MFGIFKKKVKIENSTSRTSNTKCLGIFKENSTKKNKYRAQVALMRSGKTHVFHVGSYPSLEKAKEARVNYILNLL